MRPVQFPALCTFSALIAFFGVMDMVRSVEVVIGRDFRQMELIADFPCNPHQEEGESEKESKSGEENESKESKKKKKALEVDDCDAFGSENARNVQLKSGHRLGNSSSSLALAAARIWEPPEMG
ncbi:hypothetical protein N8134_00545 [Flavobacteriales bacterium]|jgi:hypothetical protein|nr:hypothetical protein [Flavobacteriales bacterium]